MILIVDDSSDGARLTEMALSMLDPEIRTASVSSGEQALAFLKTAAEGPAMILLDLNMPGMNGIETLRRIRDDEAFKDIPVVILTFSTLESDVEAAREAGAAGLIQKAIKLQELKDDLEHQVKSWYMPKRR